MKGGQNFGEGEKQTTDLRGESSGKTEEKERKIEKEGRIKNRGKREPNNKEVLRVKRNREKERERTT
jgi:hypothetical protein